MTEVFRFKTSCTIITRANPNCTLSCYFGANAGTAAPEVLNGINDWLDNTFPREKRENWSASVGPCHNLPGK